MKRQMLRHCLATLAYRGLKAVSNAPAGFVDFHAGETTRTPGQVLAHIGDLLDWALSLAKGEPVFHESPVLPWEDGVGRFLRALKEFDSHLASDEPLEIHAEQLFQGPVADALTHVGQITMLRRMAGAPVRGENYFKADIVVGRVDAEQAAPRFEFD
jgi:hypothetical protein